MEIRKQYFSKTSSSNRKTNDNINDTVEAKHLYDYESAVNVCTKTGCHEFNTPVQVVDLFEIVY